MNVLYMDHEMPLSEAWRLSGTPIDKATVYQRMRDHWPLELALWAEKRKTGKGHHFDRPLMRDWGLP
jgi:hypothetical protein